MAFFACFAKATQIVQRALQVRTLEIHRRAAVKNTAGPLVSQWGRIVSYRGLKILFIRQKVNAQHAPLNTQRGQCDDVFIFEWMCSGLRSGTAPHTSHYITD